MKTASTTPFQLLQWKHAIKLEKLGLRVSRGRKVTPHAAKFFGLPVRSKADAVLGHIQGALDACEKARFAPTHPVSFEQGDN